MYIFCCCCCYWSHFITCIGLLPGSPFLCRRLYNFGKPEEETMVKYGRIPGHRPYSVLIFSPFFLVKKTDMFLHPCIS